MARTWQELFETGDDAPAPAPAGDGDAERGGFFRRLRDNMSKTRQAIGAELQTTIFQSLDDEALRRGVSGNALLTGRFDLDLGLLGRSSSLQIGLGQHRARPLEALPPARLAGTGRAAPAASTGATATGV